MIGIFADNRAYAPVIEEFISNASDAADKLRFRALSNPDLYEGDGELRVRVSFDKDKRTLT
ncbi:hypothetical protein, partial [Salmonella enterica]|uniref:hypothetical protein n=1 Tax=Salmonella enterica TaxID=28901 RepID=UPI002159EF7E